MSNADATTYDTRVRAIRAYNQPLLEDFRSWLYQSGLTEKTVRAHMYHVSFFAEYLVYYDDPLKKLDQANSGDVRMYLGYWFPRKAMWVSEPTVKSNMASLKKLFQWMRETGRVSPEAFANVLRTLKEGRDHFLKKAAEF